MLISAPSKCEYDPDCRYGNSIVNTHATDLLAESAKRLGVDYVDTVRRMDGNDFWVTDGHWRPEGHRKMADAILEYLRSKGHGDSGLGRRSPLATFGRHGLGSGAPPSRDPRRSRCPRTRTRSHT
jgi:hypothetical protein